MAHYVLVCIKIPFMLCTLDPNILKKYTVNVIYGNFDLVNYHFLVFVSLDPIILRAFENKAYITGRYM